MSEKTNEIRASAPHVDAEAWVDEHGDALFRYALMRVRDRHVAEDLVQETFLAGLLASQSFRGESTERTWLICILRHKVVDYLRKVGRERPSQEAMGTDRTDQIFNDKGGWRTNPGTWKVDPESLLDRAEFWAVFDKCLGALPPRLAEAFSLRVIDEMETEQVCKVLGITPSNTWVMLHRARARLRACLETNWFSRTSSESDVFGLPGLQESDRSAE